MDLEKINGEKSKAIKLLLSGIVTILVGVGAFLLSPSYPFLFTIGIIIVIVGVILVIIGFVRNSKVNEEFKRTIMPIIISEIIEDGTFDPHNGFTKNHAYSSGLLPVGDRFKSSDKITGKLDGVYFESCDLHLERRETRRTQNGTETYYVTIFLGRIFEFEFNKQFDGYLQVLESGRPLNKRKYEKVKLESVAFNKKFKTFSNTDLNAFYVLTPHLMEAIMELEKRNPGCLKLNFDDTKLYIAINNNVDTFELKLFKKIDQTQIDEFKKELYVVKDVVTSLKLNNKIFK